jgi:hypothetical protein
VKPARIDTVRSRLVGTQALLELVAAQLEDLHVLAYDRQTAARELAVTGGSRDWALDTNGDPRARDAYRQLNIAAMGACTKLAEAANTAVRLLTEGDPGEPRPRTRRTIRLHELASAVDAQARRIARGDYTPVANRPQPATSAIDGLVDRLARDLEQANARADRLAQRLERYEPTKPRRERRRRRHTA